MAKVTLSGIDALGYVHLYSRDSLMVDGAPSPVEEARVRSYVAPETVTLEVELRPGPWTPEYIRRLKDGGALHSRTKIMHYPEDGRRMIASEEYVAAGEIAAKERALWDQDTKRLRAKGWHVSLYNTHEVLKCDASGKPVKVNGRSVVRPRADVLAEIAKS